MALDILKIIKYEGGPDQLVWKHPAEDFNTGSQLIVHESQEAIFLRMVRHWIFLDLDVTL